LLRTWCNTGSDRLGLDDRLQEMKLLLTLAIRAYWRLIPPSARRTCLYRESCSRHVHRVTQEHGLRAGIEALRRRVRTCRPGSVVRILDGEPVLVLVDGTMLSRDDASPQSLEPVRKQIETMMRTVSS
jgi:hypothetical protein